MKKCAFCNEKIKMTLDYCSFCGSSKVVTQHRVSRAEHLTHYFKALRNEDLYSNSLSEHGFDIENWQLPFWIEFGKKTNLKLTIKAFKKESYLLMLGLILLSIGFFAVDKPGLISSAVLGFAVVVLKHNNFFVEALKFENPFNKPEHYILYNLDNDRGGAGKEEFILTNGDFNQIIFYYDNNQLSAINFGCSNKTIVKVDGYSDLELLERFVMLYAHKYEMKISLITDEEEIRKLDRLMINFETEFKI